MAIIPQVVTEDRASGAQFIDGSLVFDRNKEHHLTRTPSTAGNRKTWTYSAWLSRKDLTNEAILFGADEDNTNVHNWSVLRVEATPLINFLNNISNSTGIELATIQKFRDNGGWYHVVLAVDTTDGTASNRVKLYINGEQVTSFTTSSYPAEDYETQINSTNYHWIGREARGYYYDGYMSQVHFIDGQQLTASDFGYTDLLTNTWRPKKYTGDFNIATTSYDTTNATGGNTILNTNDAGTSVTSGNRTDSNSSYLKVAVPMNGSNDGTTFTDVVGGHTCTANGNVHTDTGVSKFYGSSAQFDGTGDYIDLGTHSDWSLDGDFTIECWMRINSTNKGLMCTVGDAGTSSGFEFYAAGINDFRVFEGGSGLSGYWFGYSGNPTGAADEWAHFALVRASNVAKAYVNGTDIGKTFSTSTTYSGGLVIGGEYSSGAITDSHDGYLADFRLYKGVAKYTSDFIPPGSTIITGVNSFYLPFDGKRPIGEDQSGAGNDYTPKNFAGSVTLDNPLVSGAAPILNTTNGGKVAVPGVRGQAGVAVTVYNDGGGNKYYLDGVKSTAGNVNFTPGQTVTFDTGDSTCSGHPFRLSANWDGSHTSYSSVDFDGVDGVLQYSNDVGFNFGTGAFTIEFWARIANVTQDHAAVVSLYLFGGGPFIKLRTSNRWSLYFNKDGGGNDTYDVVGIGTYNEWHHIAWVREGTGTNEMKLYMDGDKVYEATYPTDILGDNSAGHGLTLGKMQPSGGSTYFEGKLRDVRISKGVARYTSNFCPPNEPLTVDGNTSILVCNNSTTTTVSGNYAGVATAIGGVASGTSQNPFKEYVFGTVDPSVSEGTAGAATTITIPHNAPGELTYYCTAHTGMGGTVSIGATDVRTADPYAWKCNLALPWAGGEKDYTTEVSSKSSIMSSWSANSATFTPYNSGGFYSNSLYMNGASDYPRINFSAGAMNFMHNSYGIGTVEFWTKPSSVSTGAVWCSTSGGSNQIGFGIYSASDGTEAAIFISNGTSGQGSGTTASLCPTPHGKWVHIAGVKTPTQLRIYADGILRATQDISSYSFNDANSTYNYIQQGSSLQESGSRGWTDAYMSDVRVYEGLEKYTGTTVGTQYFIPPSVNPDIIEDSPSGISYSSELVEITDGAVSFDGSNDYLTTWASSSDFSFGTGDFTIECWVYTNVPSGEDGIFQISTNSGGLNASQTDTVTLQTNSGVWRTYANDTSTAFSTKVIGDKWVHLALVRASGTLRLYVDGVVDATTISDSRDYGGTYLCIGGYYSSSYLWNGFISNFRVVKGTAVYTSDFTPSKSSLTNITNTKILCCQSPVQPGAGVTSPNMGGVNDGTQWSIGGFGDSNWDSSYPIENGFNGEATYTGSYVGMARPQNANVTATWNAPKPISFTTLKLTAARDSGSYADAIKINGVDVTSQFTASTSTLATVTITGVSSPLTKLELTASAGAAQPRFTAIYIDNVMLVDPMTPENTASAAATNFNPFTTNINTVLGRPSSYCTWNPLKMGTSDVSMSEDNLYWKTTSNGPDHCTYGTIGMDSGKWYWECEVVEATATGIGIANELANADSGPAQSHNWIYYSATGQKYIDGSGSSYGAAYTTNGTIIGVAFDRDNLTLEFYKDGVSQGKLSSISGLTDSETYYPMVGDSGGASQSIIRGNFGQKPFKYTPPEGFLPLNVANIPRPTIVRPDQYVKPVVYTGNDSGNNSGTGNTWGIPVDVGFAPDLVWLKSRTQTYGWYIYDTVRGGNKDGGTVVPGVDKQCYNYMLMEGTNAEVNAGTNGDSTLNGIGMNQKGFNVDIGGQAVGEAAQGTHNMAAWCWKAGGWKGTWNLNGEDAGSAAAAGLTTGDTSVLTGASINTVAGFSIVKWTQDSGGSSKNIAHGLTQAPNFVIMKHVNSTSNWFVSHTSLASGAKVLYMDTDDDEDNSSDFGSAFPGATYTATGTTGVNGREVIMYSWHNISGFQKFGSYIANDSADGPFINLGFRPAIVMVKVYSGGTNNWVIWDRARMEATGNNSSSQSTGNPNGNTLQPDDTTEEPTSGLYYVDFLSNGFKLRVGGSGALRVNGNSTSYKYVYCAWAETPQSNLYGGQSNAL